MSLLLLSQLKTIFVQKNTQQLKFNFQPSRPDYSNILKWLNPHGGAKHFHKCAKKKYVVPSHGQSLTSNTFTFSPIQMWCVYIHPFIMEKKLMLYTYSIQLYSLTLWMYNCGSEAFSSPPHTKQNLKLKFNCLQLCHYCPGRQLSYMLSMHWTRI